MIPGFVDGHTHPVFDGDRSNEFAMKLAGAGYMEIHKQGGGIHYTVNGQLPLFSPFYPIQKRGNAQKND